MEKFDVAEREEAIFRKHMEMARLELEAELQAAADRTPDAGTDRLPLMQVRTTTMDILTRMGRVRIRVRMGRRATLRKVGRKYKRCWETPFRELHFRGEHAAVTPGVEELVVMVACETGSFEKGAAICGKFGLGLSDDRARGVTLRAGRACKPELLPGKSERAAGPDDILVVMMDGWMARHRGGGWGVEGTGPEEKTDWKEIKSAVMFRLSGLCETGRNRRILVEKHIVASPPDTDPADFGAKVRAAAVRMGLGTARKTYVVQDGGIALWNIFEDRFARCATGELDYYHASEHLHALADALFPAAEDAARRETWLRAVLDGLRQEGYSPLADALDAAEKSLSDPKTAEAAAILREIAYFRKHERHMAYDKAAAEGVPIGSGAMESQCSQFQNRFKRRGQFWTARGSGPFLEAYAWYANGELPFLRKRPA